MDKNMINKYVDELNKKLDIVFEGLKKDILNDFEERVIKNVAAINNASSKITVENSVKVVNEVIEKVIWSGDDRERFIVIRAKVINDQLKTIGITKNTFYQMLDLVEAFRKDKEGKYTSVYADKVPATTMRAYKLDKYYLIQNDIEYCNDSSIDKKRFQVIDNKVVYVINNGSSYKYVY